MKIYLAGKIPKSDEIGKLEDWRAKYREILSVLEGIEFLNPEDPDLDESYPFLVFGHDCSLVKQCNVLIVNASTKLGAGTSQEMIIAKFFQKPVITVLPKNSHHRKSNLVMYGKIVKDWIHPYIYSTSDLIVETPEQALKWLKEYIADANSKNIKGIEIVEQAISDYKHFHDTTISNSPNLD